MPRGEPFVPTGGTLAQIRRIDLSGARELLAGVKITAMCDVDNPLCGPEGAAAVFGPQKGAAAETVRLLDRGLHSLREVVYAETGRDLADVPGAGAAGGFGFGCMALLGGTLRPGIETLLDLAGFDRLLGARPTSSSPVRDGSTARACAARSSAASPAARRGASPSSPSSAASRTTRCPPTDSAWTRCSPSTARRCPFSESAPRSAADYRATLRDVLRVWQLGRVGHSH